MKLSKYKNIVFQQTYAELKTMDTFRFDNELELNDMELNVPMKLFETNNKRFKVPEDMFYVMGFQPTYAELKTMDAFQFDNELELNDMELNVPMKLFETNNKRFKVPEDIYQTFEIYTERLNTDVEEINTTRCHICDFDVPEIFVQEHLSSEKHTMLTSLAANAVKRIQLQASEPLIQINQVIPNVYYCAVCSAAVKQSDRLNHELSTQHLDNVKRDTLLQQLSNIYNSDGLNNHNLNVVNVKANGFNDNLIDNSRGLTKDNGRKTFQNNINSSKINKDHELNVVNDNLNDNFRDLAKANGLETFQNNIDASKINKDHEFNVVNDNLNDSSRGLTKANGLETFQNNINSSKINKDHEFNVVNDNLNDNSRGLTKDNGRKTFQNNINSSKINKDHEFNVVNDNSRDLTKANGLETFQNNIDASEINKNQENTFSTKKFYCDICKIEIAHNKALINEHKSSTDHHIALNKYVDFLITYQMIPKLNNKWFCIVCSMEVDSTKHVRSDDHKIAYEKLLSENKLVKTSHQILKCNVCDVEVRKGEELAHTRIRSHSKRINIAENEEDLIDHYNSSNLEDNRAESRKDIVFDIFSWDSSYDSIESETSEKGEMLTKIYNDILSIIAGSQSKPKQNDDDCSKHAGPAVIKNEVNDNKKLNENVIVKESKLKHKIDPNYQDDTKVRNQGLLDDLPVPMKEAGTQLQYICTICKVYYNNANDLKCHENGAYHKQKLNELSKNKEETCNKMAYVCSICNLHVLNNANMIKLHENGTYHKQKLNELSKNKEEPCKKEPYIPYMCSVCKVEVPNNANDLKCHENGTYHKQKLNELSKNKEETCKKMPYIPYICSVCKVEVPNNAKDIKFHNNGVKHKQKLNELSKNKEETCKKMAYICSICKMNIPNNASDIKLHENGPYHKQKLSELGKNNEKTCKKMPYICSVCKVEVPNNAKNIQSHENGANHKKRLIAFTKKKDETGKRMAYICSICKVEVPNNLNDIVCHENGAKHKQKLNTLFPNPANHNNVMCPVCNELIPINDLSRHENEAKHIKYLNGYKASRYCNMCKGQASDIVDHMQLHMKALKEHTDFQLQLPSSSLGFNSF